MDVTAQNKTSTTAQEPQIRDLELQYLPKSSSQQGSSHIGDARSPDSSAGQTEPGQLTSASEAATDTCSTDNTPPGVQGGQENAPSWGPPISSSACDESLRRKVEIYHQRRCEGAHLNEDLKKSKTFNNPDILEKLIEHYRIEEIGSNFPPSVWNPRKFAGSAFFYDKLAQRQDEYYQTLSASQVGRRSVGFVGGGSSVVSHVQRSLQKYSGPVSSELANSQPSGKRKNPPDPSPSSDPKRPKR